MAFHDRRPLTADQLETRFSSAISAYNDGMSDHTVALLSIVAIIAGPIIALGLQRWTEARREKRQGRLWVFRALMMHRATPLAYSYVQALNLIDVVFNSESKKEKAVRTDWKILLNHLTRDQGRPDFGDVSRTMTAKLLADMGACLGYDFDEVYLKDHAYQPRGHGEIEEEQHALRKLQLQVLNGKRRLPVAIFPDQFPDIVLPTDLPTLRLNDLDARGDSHDE